MCLAIVKPPGFFQRLFGGLKLNLSVNASPGDTATSGFHVKMTAHRSQSFQIHDATTGETNVYHSLDEVPEKYRQQISQAMTDGRGVRTEQIISVGPDGVRHTYKSLDEVPPSVRKLIDGAEQTPDPK